MFIIKDTHGAVEFTRRPAAMPAGSAFHVQHGDRRVVIYLLAGLGDAIGPVQVFPVHEEILVQQPDLLDGLTLH